MTDDVRRILKVFGIAVTDFEEKQRQIAESLSPQAKDSDKEAALFREACEGLLDLQEKWMEATRVVFDVQKNLFQQVLRRP
ncbi:MAG: hypothetical protein ACE5JS_10835 [Nitrospinota bacterium]